MKKINITISFPNGAHFFSNINISIYKQFISFIHKMNCLSPFQKCMECQLRNGCRYIECTGDNFKYYPGILIKNDIFTKSIYQNQEEMEISFYLIGKMESYYQYVHLFITKFLGQELNGNFFYVKKITMEDLDDSLCCVDSIKVKSPISNLSFTNEYNDMVTYYNEHYGTSFSLIVADEKLISSKYISQSKINLKTKKINIKGYTLYSIFDKQIQIPKSLIEVGIGRFNYVGGGKIETQNNNDKT